METYNILRKRFYGRMNNYKIRKHFIQIRHRVLDTEGHRQMNVGAILVATELFVFPFHRWDHPKYQTCQIMLVSHQIPHPSTVLADTFNLSVNDKLVTIEQWNDQ